jgi:hypothetical protein
VPGRLLPAPLAPQQQLPLALELLRQAQRLQPAEVQVMHLKLVLQQD